MEGLVLVWFRPLARAAFPLLLYILLLDAEGIGHILKIL
jgi:hypothetical protein